MRRQRAVYITGHLLGRPQRTRRRTRAQVLAAVRHERAAGRVSGPRWVDLQDSHDHMVRIKGVLGWGRVELLDVALPACPAATRRVTTRWAGALRRGARIEAGAIRYSAAAGGFVLQPIRVLSYVPIGAGRDSAEILGVDIAPPGRHRKAAPTAAQRLALRRDHGTRWRRKKRDKAVS